MKRKASLFEKELGNIVIDLFPIWLLHFAPQSMRTGFTTPESEMYLSRCSLVRNHRTSPSGHSVPHSGGLMFSTFGSGLMCFTVSPHTLQYASTSSVLIACVYTSGASPTRQPCETSSLAFCHRAFAGHPCGPHVPQKHPHPSRQLRDWSFNTSFLNRLLLSLFTSQQHGVLKCDNRNGQAQSLWNQYPPVWGSLRVGPRNYPHDSNRRNSGHPK